MNKFLLKSLLILGLFLGLNYAYLEILKITDWSISKVSKEVDFKDKDFDYLFLGASLTLDGIDSRLLTKNGFKSYNLGLGGASLKTTYIQLIHYLNNNKKPKTVILGIGSLSKSYKEYKETRISQSVEYFYFKNDISFENLPLVKFRGAALENLKMVVSKDHREAEIVEGQLRIKKKVKDNTKYQKNLDHEIHISDYKGAVHLFKIDSICKSRGIKFFVIEMPGFKKTQNNIPIGPHKLADKNHDTVVLYNLNNKDLVSNLIDSDNDWLGNSHLNEYGAIKLTKYICDNILN